MTQTDTEKLRAVADMLGTSPAAMLVLVAADEIDNYRKTIPSLTSIRDGLDQMHKQLHDVADNYEAVCYLGGFQMPPRKLPYS